MIKAKCSLVLAIRENGNPRYSPGDGINPRAPADVIAEAHVVDSLDIRQAIYESYRLPLYTATTPACLFPLDVESAA